MKEARQKLGKKNPREEPHASLWSLMRRWHKCLKGDETEKSIYGLLVNENVNFLLL